MRLELVRRETLGELVPSWDDLVATGPLPSPFAMSWFVENAARGEPAILTCHDERGRLVGGAPFELDRVGAVPCLTGATGNHPGVRRVRVLGQGTLAPDHVDVIAEPEHRPEVLAAVARWLRSGNWVVDLDGLSATCELPELLAAPVVDRTAAPYLRLGPGDPVAALPGRLRNSIKRSSKRLARAGFELRRVEPSGAEDALDTLLRLHDHRWADRSSWGSQHDPGDRDRLRNTLAAGLRCGDAVIHELTDSETVIASELELLAGTRCAFYQAGRLTDHDHRGSGSVLKAKVLQWAVAQRMTEFDLLRGDEAYKGDWSNDRRELRRIRTGFGPAGRPAAWAMNRWQIIAPSVRRIAAKLRSGTSQLDQHLGEHSTGTS